MGCSGQRFGSGIYLYRQYRIPHSYLYRSGDDIVKCGVNSFVFYIGAYDLIICSLTDGSRTPVDISMTSGSSVTFTAAQVSGATLPGGDNHTGAAYRTDTTIHPAGGDHRIRREFIAEKIIL